MRRDVVGALSSLVTAMALAGWAVLADWWATTEDAVADELWDVQIRLADLDAEGATSGVERVRPLFDGGQAMELDGDPTIPFLFERVEVPPWRLAGAHREQFAMLDAESRALAARYAELQGGGLAPVVRAIASVDPKLRDVLPYDPLPPAEQWVVYERSDASHPDVPIAAPLLVSPAQFRLPDRLRGRGAGPNVGFALRIADVVELTGLNSAPIRIGSLSIPALPQSRSWTWWLVGRTEPIEVWGVFATTGSEDTAVVGALAERSRRVHEGPPAGSEMRPSKVKGGGVLEQMCVTLGRPLDCYSRLDFLAP